MEGNSGLALLLIPALAGGTQQQLSAALGGMVDVPVVAAVNCTPIPLCLENRGFNGMYICVLCTFSLYVKSKQIFSFQKSPLAFIY